MTNPFDGRAIPLSGPAFDVAAITPDDATTLEPFAASIYIETGGAVTFETIAGSQVTMQVGDYSILPVGAQKVLATGTTATGLFALLVS